MGTRCQMGELPDEPDPDEEPEGGDLATAEVR